MILRNNMKKEEKGLATALEILKSNVEQIMKKYLSCCYSW
jgi:hypothetical protein